MFARLVVPLAALAAHVSAQTSTFEPVDFNVTAALEKLGVDVSVLPEPEKSTIAERSLLQPCALAVSRSEAANNHDDVDIQLSVLL
jgi:hypothetical protein